VKSNSSPRASAFIAAVILGLGLTLGAGAAAAQTSFPVDKLMAPGPLPDIVQGSPSAPVTIIEYASMTCTHCATFQAETLPKLKEKYIDTGKAKLILREFPLNELDVAALMLARCAGPEKRTAIVDMLFAQQNAWAFQPNSFAYNKPEALAGIAKQAGLSQADFEACIKNPGLLAKVYAARQHAVDVFKITSAPTFFVNGQILTGEPPIEEFDKVIQPLLK
jgi:protein-disulfide isomerase